MEGICGGIIGCNERNDFIPSICISKCYYAACPILVSDGYPCLPGSRFSHGTYEAPSSECVCRKC